MLYNLYHINGLFFEIISDEGKNREYEVSFQDRISGHIIYQVKLKPSSWAKLNRKYLSDIKIIIKYDGNIVKEINVLDELKNNKVFIVFESKSLGDTIAWMPYCLEFSNRYGCKVIVSTFLNELFESVYPELQFVGRGVVVNNIKAMIELGWFWDEDKEPSHPATIPLQKSASNLLCLEHKEIRPKIAFDLQERTIFEKYICISSRSTAQCKHWYYWAELVQILKDKGYRVIELSKDADDYGAEKINDKSLQMAMNYLYHADYYIGLSSGISWLNWSVGKHTIMISNFSEFGHEFVSNCTRINNLDVCNSCWNNPLFKFDKGNWNWCPKHEHTDRQFECHKSIKPDLISKLIK